MRNPRRVALAVAVAALVGASLAFPPSRAPLVVLGSLIAAGAAGFVWNVWRHRRALSPDEADKDRLARAIVRQARRLPSPALLHDNENKRSLSVERRWAGVLIGVADHGDVDLDLPGGVRPDATVTWYIVPRWAEDCSRVLRHVAPAGQRLGGPSPAEMDDLLRLDRETGALGADIEEIRSLLKMLNAARRPL